MFNQSETKVAGKEGFIIALTNGEIITGLIFKNTARRNKDVFALVKLVDQIINSSRLTVESKKIKIFNLIGVFSSEEQVKNITGLRKDVTVGRNVLVYPALRAVSLTSGAENKYLKKEVPGTRAESITMDKKI